MMEEISIKEFGMTNLLIETDLIDLEKKFGIDLGKRKKYTKFRRSELAKEFPVELRKQAAEMANYYEIIFCIERTIRDLISERLEQKSTNWWEDEGIISADIKRDIKKRIEDDSRLNIDPRSENKIDYTSFIHLKEIIFQNWADFEDIFRNKNALGRIFDELNFLRNAIAHSCSLTDYEIERLFFVLKGWSQFME